MIRALAWLVATMFLGGIAHLATIFVLPYIAERDAYARLAPVTETNAMTLLSQPSPAGAPLPFMDPAFATAICRFDLRDGPLSLHVPLTQAYTSIAFYTRQGTVFYSINDRAAGRRSIELEFMTARQRSQMQEDEEVTAADRLIVESASLTGLIAVRALAAEPTLLPVVRGALSTARCGLPEKRPEAEP